MTYLPWAFAWGEIKKLYPESFYTIYENAEGLNYHTDGKTAWVKTGVTIVWEEDGVRKQLEHIEDLPVMDMRNQSIPIANLTSTAVNKAIQRSLVKACARHGLGLYIFSGEDLPEDESPARMRKRVAAAPTGQVIRSAEANKFFESVDAAIQKKTAGMDAAQKKAFAAELKSICGVVNYKTITDEDTLRVLYDRYVMKKE